MLGGVKLKVVFTHERTCFAYISSKYSTNSNQSQTIQVLSNTKQIYLWAVFNNNVPEGQIACNPTFSRQIGLVEGAEVFVSPYGDVRVLDELYVDTDSPEDQEILEHNAEILQLRLLDQLRLVHANQKVVVWISTSLPIVFTPKQTGLLVNQSRVIVKVDAFNSFHGSLRNVPEPPKESESIFKNIGLINEGMLKPYMNVPKTLIVRAIPIDSDGNKNLIHPYKVFLHENLLDKYKDVSVILATVKSIPSLLHQKDENAENNNNVNDICVEVILIDNVVFKSLCREVYNENIPTVLIPKSLNAIVNIENGVKIILTIIGENLEHPEHIDIVTYSEETQAEIEIIEKFKNCVIESTHSGKKFLINDSLVKQNHMISKGFIQFKLKPENLKYTLLNSESFRHCTVSAQCLKDTDFAFPKPVISNLEYDFKNYCRTMKSVVSLVEKIFSHIYFEIHRDASFKGTSEIKSNILITGQSGTGKSSLCYIIQKDLTTWSHVLHCRSLKGRKDIADVLGKSILMCQEHSPAVLFCDDLDALVPANLEGLSPQDLAYYQRLAVVIKHLLQSCAGVCVVMTALSVKSLHPALKHLSGKPLFTAQFTIPELNQDERAELFKHLINDKIKEEFEVGDDDVIRLAMDTAGCTVRDVTDRFNKVIFKAVKKKKQSIKPRLVEDVTKDEEKANAFDIWDSVGGLHDVKQKITEAVFWPIMYPALFPSRSCGILLYGPPGTGKSHIGSCLAKLTNMELITVKGPELLSKYIGQSEKAIRDIFDKADMKRPCILFFDEFDSLAPKRGHDSTGVTDRVVNQILTRLDGAEAGAGPVLAATARPDLLDPALLRPGRLANHLHTAPPPQGDRLEILRILSKSVAIHPEVDLEELSERTEGYSPADIKSLLVTAQLTRLEKQLDANEEEKSMESVVVYKADIESALQETKPSLSKEQRIFYDAIYKKFRGESLTPQEKAIAAGMQKQRVTLA